MQAVMMEGRDNQRVCEVDNEQRNGWSILLRSATAELSISVGMLFVGVVWCAVGTAGDSDASLLRGEPIGVVGSRDRRHLHSSARGRSTLAITSCGRAPHAANPEDGEKS